MRLQAADQCRIDAGNLRGGHFQPAGNVLEPALQAADRHVVAGIGRARLDALGKRGEAGVDRLHDTGAVVLLHALVEPVGDFVQPPLEVAEQHVALLDRIALAAFEQRGQRVETLLQALEDIVGVGHRRRAVHFVRD